MAAGFLRGGSWNNNPENLQCSARNNNNPENQWNNNGFRVVVAQSCPLTEPDVGVLWNIGLVFGHDMRFFLLGHLYKV